MKCYEKRRYPLIELANKASSKYNLKFKKYYYVYKCDECEGYHLTTMKPKLVREIKLKKK